MINYEAVFVLRTEDDLFNKGKEIVDSELKKVDAEIQGEEDMGVKDLAYLLGDQRKGHYYLYKFQTDPLQVQTFEDSIKHKAEILRHIVVKLDQ